MASGRVSELVLYTMSLDFVLFLCLLCCVECFKYNTLKNFTHSLAAALHPTDPIVIDKTCLLPAERGPCRGNLKMFFFEPSSMSCSTFRWGGCQGNGNRFDTEHNCMTRCVGTRGHTVRPHWCSLSFDIGYCFALLPRWYYDPRERVCKERFYSGCGGNRNNFLTKEQCSATCVYKKDGPIDN